MTSRQLLSVGEDRFRVGPWHADDRIAYLALQPQFGEDRARQVASLSGVALVLLVSWLFVRFSPGARPGTRSGSLVGERIVVKVPSAAIRPT